MSTGTESGSPALNLEKCAVVLLDVAGTTTSINFVKETLFPYVTKQVEEFLKAQWEDESVKEAVKALKEDKLDLAGATAAVKELTEQNSENKGLKTIQGLIYKKGYEGGDLKAHVFSDVASSLEDWAKSRKIAIYSTGSIESQQLLFAHTAEGDITSHITKYFDQSVGNKTETGSYEKIAKELDVKTEEIVFVTDNMKEAEAAKTAGVVSVLVKREGNEEIPEKASKTFPIVSTFQEIVFKNSVKRKNEEDSLPTEEQQPSKLPKTDAADDKAAATEGEETVKAEGTTSQTEEKMEVDAPAEKEIKVAEEKSKGKPSEPTTDNDKTEKDSDSVKTEETVVEEKKTEKVEETPMDTADSTVEVEKEEKVNEPKETEAKKEETVVKEKEETVVKEKENPKEEQIDTTVETVVEEIKEKVVEDETGSKTEQMEAENSTETHITKESKDTETIETKGDTITEQMEAECNPESSSKKDLALTETTDTAKVEVKDVDSTTQDTTETKDAEMIAASTSENKEVDNKTAVEDKSEEKKIEVPSEKTEEKVVPSEDDKTSKKEEITQDKIEEPKVETESNGQPEVQVAESSTSKCEEPVEKKESVEPCTKEEEKVEASCSSEADKKETTETPKEEKENKSELANGIINGDSPVNGEAKNGDAKAEESDKKVEDIKVKKVEEAPDSSPAVSVEV